MKMSAGMRVAVLVILVTFLYLFAVTFVPMFAPLPEAGQNQANTITPYLLGILGILVGFYYGKKHEPSPTIEDRRKEGV
jgi:NADH:ubiquinone oxidoreductase subunit 6 (subunit J)